MPHKRFTALLATACTLTGCTAPPATPTPPRASAQLGTISPAYPVDTDLEAGIEVLATIPTTDLPTDKPIPINVADPCASIPADVVTPAGVAVTPVLSDEVGCVWRGPELGLEIGAMPYSMAWEVEEHRAMSTGRSEPLAHLAWLRIDGHYAIERILEFDPGKGCWLTLDTSSSATMRVLVYAIDPTTGETAEHDTETSVRDICPASRKVAKNLLNHLDPKDDHELEWWESVIHPTG